MNSVNEAFLDRIENAIANGMLHEAYELLSSHSIELKEIWENLSLTHINESKFKETLIDGHVDETENKDCRGGGMVDALVPITSDHKS